MFCYVLYVLKHLFATENCSGEGEWGRQWEREEGGRGG